MKRNKRLGLNKEKPGTSSAMSKAAKEQDLAYYVHDRVELMRQVFSVLSPKEIKAMAPECLRKHANDEVEEICLDELLGISSKRVCAIIDGAASLSDTDTSTSESEGDGKELEMISLESVSDSDRSKKRHKKCRRRRRSSPHPAIPTPTPTIPTVPTGRAQSASTVLELLELQARARALRSQLGRQGTAALPPTPTNTHPHTHTHTDTDTEVVVVKAESPEVLEISSDEEERKPAAAVLSARGAEPQPPPPPPPPPPVQPTSSTSTKQKKKKKKRSKEKSPSYTHTRASSSVTPVAAQSEPPSPPKVDNKDTNPSVDNKDDDVTIIDLDDDDDEHQQETTASKKAKKSPTMEKQASPESLKITINPQKTTRKIHLNRNNVVISVHNAPEPEAREARVASVAVPVKKINSTVNKVKKPDKLSSKVVVAKKSAKKKSRNSFLDKDNDNYEITLQLSDTEKMDLLEDLHPKDLDTVTSGSESHDSESSSSTESDTSADIETKIKTTDSTLVNNDVDKVNTISKWADNKNGSLQEVVKETVKDKMNEDVAINEIRITPESLKIGAESVNKDNICVSAEQTMEVSCIEDIPIVREEFGPKLQTEIESNEIVSNDNIVSSTKDSVNTVVVTENNGSITAVANENDDNINISEKTNEELNTKTASEEDLEINTAEDMDKEIEEAKNMEEGELSDRSDSEVEAFDVQPEIVCISDEDEAEKSAKKKKNKKHKKEKKCYKHRKPQTEVADENFFRQKEVAEKGDTAIQTPTEIITEVAPKSPANPDSDVYEILDLSDDSSCYEVEGFSVSKEPTSEEIEALSAKIDEIERVDVITGEQITEPTVEENAENISWKDRYLDSKKVKQVLTTSNILNAMRKKNKELKNKMIESKRIELEVEANKVETPKADEVTEEVNIEEGSIEHFNRLECSTKYVDPVPEPQEKTTEESAEKETENQLNLTNEMKNDAKQLLKMYKRLLKYNDINKQKQKDPNKKKKSKKQKKKKDGGVTSVATAENT